MQNYVLIIFLWTFLYQLLYFTHKFKKTDNFRQNCRFFEIFWQNTTASTKTFTEKKLGHTFALHFTSYLSIALSKILPHSKTIENAKKLLVFGKNDSRCLSHFFEIHIFLNFDHIYRTCNQINYRDIWFAKSNNNSYHDGTSAFFRWFFSKKTCTLMPLR